MSGWPFILEWLMLPGGRADAGDRERRTDGVPVDTCIEVMDEARMVVGSADGRQLILTWDKRSRKYEVSPEWKTSGVKRL